jgi:ATP-dependent Lon protease
MTPLNQKINTHFPGLVVRKDLVKTVKGNAIVPTYVLEYLLGQYCATNDEATIQTGIETVKEILGRHYVHRNEAGLVRSNIKEKGRYKVIDKISVELNDKADVYEATFSNLGIETLGAEASMVFVGNTRHTVPYMLKHSDLCSELPEQFYDSAFLDRVHFYIPGWEVDIIRGEMFSDGYGFVVDYLAEILRSLRNHDYSDQYSEHFSLSPDISTRDRDGIQKTFSGLMKILFPHGGASKEDVDMVLRFAVEGRKRVKDQLMRIDTTYSHVNFSYSDAAGKPRAVTTLEEEEYPKYYYKTVVEGEDGDIEGADPDLSEPLSAESPAPDAFPGDSFPSEQHLGFQAWIFFSIMR